MAAHADAVLAQLFKTLQQRRNADPKSSYVAQLCAGGADRILKKVAEEAGEVLIAAKNEDDAELVHELADLWFHTMVLMAQRNLPLETLTNELAGRMNRSGLEEKAARERAED